MFLLRMEIKNIIPYIAIVTLLLIIAILVLYTSNVEENDGFTELYFLDDIPKSVEVNKEYDFSFAIHNLENKDMFYQYIIFLESNELSQETVSLSHDATEIINQKFSVNSPLGDEMQISVQLLNKNQEIHFKVKIK